MLPCTCQKIHVSCAIYRLRSWHVVAGIINTLDALLQQGTRGAGVDSPPPKKETSKQYIKRVTCMKKLKRPEELLPTLENQNDWVDLHTVARSKHAVECGFACATVSNRHSQAKHVGLVSLGHCVSVVNELKANFHVFAILKTFKESNIRRQLLVT